MSTRITVLVCLGVLVGILAPAAQGDFRENLLAHWPMDEGSGSVVADTVGGYDGTIEGEITWTEGMFGSAIDFPGATGNNVNCGNIDLNIGSDFTLACWIMMPDCEGRFQDIFAKGPKVAGHYELYINGSGGGGGGRLRGGAAAYIPDLGDFWSNVKVDDEAWHHIAWTYDGTTMTCYVDGGSTGQKTWNVNGSVAATTGQFRIGSLAEQTNPFGGMVDDVAIFNRSLMQEEVQEMMEGLAERKTAMEANPADGDEEMPRDVVLTWSPGEFAATHDVYLGTSFDDVALASRDNPLEVLVSQGQAATTYDPPERLEFGQTYYWRVDEVNAPPDSTIFSGDVWSFTVEPFVYPITDVTATSNGVSEEGFGPERTVDGSGLDAATGQHSTSDVDMWLATAAEAEPLWIQYEFDRVYKLHEMNVWNYNVTVEKVVGFGLKNVLIEYSTDGQEWQTLGSVEFAQAAGKATEMGQTVGLDGVPAKYVRLNVDSAWGTLGQYGLSEVRFHQIPTFAREPQPADGTSDVPVDSMLNWRAGREVDTHHVRFSTNEATVADDGVAAEVTNETSFNPGELNVASTYYWRVDEVNEAEVTSVWEGNVWSFTTQ